jgi:hypothetical protein
MANAQQEQYALAKSGELLHRPGGGRQRSLDIPGSAAGWLAFPSLGSFEGGGAGCGRSAARQRGMGSMPPPPRVAREPRWDRSHPCWYSSPESARATTARERRGQV